MKKSVVEDKKNYSLSIGDLIFWERDGDFYFDVIKESLITEEGCLYVPKEHDYWVVQDSELITEKDERVRRILSVRKDKQISLKEAREWLQDHARRYYEPDSWSSFHDEKLIIDFCCAMFYD